MGTASYRHTQTDYEYLHQLSKGAQDENNEYVTSSRTRGAGVTIHILDDGYRPIYPKAPATTAAPESYTYSWPPGAEGIVVSGKLEYCCFYLLYNTDMFSRTLMKVGSCKTIHLSP